MNDPIVIRQGFRWCVDDIESRAADQLLGCRAHGSCRFVQSLRFGKSGPYPLGGFRRGRRPQYRNARRVKRGFFGFQAKVFDTATSDAVGRRIPRSLSNRHCCGLQRTTGLCNRLLFDSLRELPRFSASSSSITVLGLRSVQSRQPPFAASYQPRHLPGKPAVSKPKTASLAALPFGRMEPGARPQPGSHPVTTAGMELEDAGSSVLSGGHRSCSVSISAPRHATAME
jgi:hypothetical protein